jgi:hypothetical protein
MFMQKLTTSRYPYPLEHVCGEWIHPHMEIEEADWEARTRRKASSEEGDDDDDDDDNDGAEEDNGAKKENAIS